MRRIKFIKELGRRQGQGAGPEYKAGDFHVFDGYVAETYAQAYIDRGYAVDAPAGIRQQASTDAKYGEMIPIDVKHPARIGGLIPDKEVDIGLNQPVYNRPTSHKPFKK